MRRTGFSDVPHHIPLAVPPGAVLDGMLREARRPEAEAVMVLAGQDQAGHAAAGRGAHDLVRIEGGRVEHGLATRRRTPIRCR